MIFSLLIKGFMTGGSLIVAIGSQNAFVLKQGLQRHHLLLTALFCSVVDAVLISLGVLGFGHVVLAVPFLLDICRYCAVGFLAVYGFFAFKSALSPKKLEDFSTSHISVKSTLIILSTFSLLNPHVYLDTVVLLGSIAAQYTLLERLYFALGAISASFMWFFLLTYGARLLRPYFQSEMSWKITDLVVCFVMWSMAISLCFAPSIAERMN